MHEVTIIEELYLKAIQFPDLIQRAAYLDSACENDHDLRRKVEELLNAHAQVGKFLEPLPQSTQIYSPHGQVPTKEGVLIGNRYKLLEKIGEGGMGEVWMADQTDPVKRRVAVKLIKPGMDSRNVLARFAAERQALAVMDHPNIAKVLDGGLHEGRPFFVMELVRGTPITEFCDVRRLTPHQRLELMVPVCQAIQHAHQKGVIHRDIKPSNVLVELYDDVPVPKVIDFGVAKAVGQPLTEGTLFTGYGTLVGTPAYMAPEQATFNALDVDTRADVYALGTLLYELLAGSPPMEAERVKKAALEEVLRLVREEEPPKPSQRVSTSEARASIAAVRGSEPAKLTAQMRGELDWIVMKALEKDRTRRYESATALAKDLQRYLTGEAVEACPPTISYRLRKACFRNRSKLGIAAAIVGVLLSGLAVAGYAWKQRLDQRVATELAATKSIDEAMVLRGEAKAAPSGELGKWNEALVAAKQAEAVIQAGESGTILRERVAQLIASIQNEEKEARQTASETQAKHQREQNLLARIEAIRIDFVEADEVHYYSADAKETIAKADQAYTKAFLEFGIDVDTDSPTKAAEKILACSRPQEIVWAIDAWAMNRKCLAMEEKNEEKERTKSQWNPEKISRAERLVQLAKLIDSDPWRCELRDNACKPDYVEALVNDNSVDTTQAVSGYARMQELLMDEKQLTRQPARGLYVISLMIEHSWHNEFGKDRKFQHLPVTKALRKRAWQLSPNDFQISWFVSTECRSQSEERAYALAAAAAAPASKFAKELDFGQENPAIDKHFQLHNIETVKPNGKAPDWTFPHITTHSPTGETVYFGPTRFESLDAESHQTLIDYANELEWLVRLQPENLALGERLASTLVRLGHIDEALKLCQRLSKLKGAKHPADMIAYELTGMGELEKAESLIEERFRIAPDLYSINRFDATLSATLGAIRLEHGDRSGAFEAFRDAHHRVWVTQDGHRMQSTMGGWDDLMIATGTPQQVSSAYRDWLADPNRMGSDSWLIGSWAEYLTATGHTEAATEVYRAAIEKQVDVRYLYDLGNILFESKQSDEAIDLCRDAASRNPGNADVREALVWMLVRSDRQGEAMNELENLEKLYRNKLQESSDRKVKCNLASVLWALQKREEARQFYRECIAESDDINNLNTFAMEMAQMLPPEYRDADLALAAAMRTNDLTSHGNPMYLDTLATAYAAKGNFEQAIKWQLRAIELNSDREVDKLFRENLDIFRAGKALPPQDNYGRRPRSRP